MSACFVLRVVESEDKRNSVIIKPGMVAQIPALEGRDRRITELNYLVSF